VATAGVGLGIDFVGGVMGAINGAKGAPSLLIQIGAWVAGTLVPGLTGAGGTLLRGFTDMGGAIGKGMANAFVSFFQVGLNKMIDAIDSIKFDIKIPNPMGGSFNVGFPGAGIGHVKIPQMATGAWNLASDMLAMVHKGEMVVPAAPAAQLRNTWAGGAPSGGGGTTVHIIQVTLDGKQISEVVDRHQGTRFLLSGSSKARPT
jgi:hypothetical protein